MVVFSVQSSAHAWTEVDLFLEAPFEFDDALARAVLLKIGPSLTATVIGLEDLIAMKRKAGRPVDLIDIAMLEARRTDPEPTDG